MASIVASFRYRLAAQRESDKLTEARREALTVPSRKTTERAKGEQYPMERVDRSIAQPLSYDQERLWFLEQLEHAGGMSHVSRAVRLRGLLNEDALIRGLEGLVRRHESLRTRVVTEAGQVKQVVDETGVFELRVEAARSEGLRAQVSEEVQRPFELAAGSLFRASLLKEGPESCVLVFSAHQIVSDGRSVALLIDELSVNYAAYAQRQEPVLPALPVQYVDYAAWQRKWLEGEELAKQLEHWKERLAGAPASSTIPTDRARPTTQSHRGASVPVVLGKETVEALDRLCDEHELTPFMGLLAALSLLLARYSGQRDVVVGTTADNRRRKEVEGVVGFFVNALALRVQIGSRETVKELLARVKNETLLAYQYQDAPFEKVVDAAGVERSLAHAPLFQVMLVLQSNCSGSANLAGVETSEFESETTTEKFDMTLSLRESEDNYAGSLSYAADLYDRETLEQFVGHFVRTVQELVARPDSRPLELDLLSEREHHQQLVEWNGAACDYPKDALIHDLFAGQAQKSPNAIAVSYKGTTLTYRDLDERSNQLAHHLQAKGVGPDVLVAVCMERSPAMIVGLLGILKAGGAYVPLDPHYPEDRLAYMRADSGAQLVLTQAHLGQAASTAKLFLDTDWPEIERQPVKPASANTRPENLAYVIYTSGSTGRPKGMLVPHRGVLNLATTSRFDLPLRGDSRVLQFASQSFDTSVGEIFPTLLSGARLCLLEGERTALSAEELLDQLERDRITVAWIPPALLGVMEPRASLSLETLITAGEACPPEVVRRWNYPGLHFVNEYGPTETTVCATRASLELTHRQPPIGRPIKNTRLYVLDGCQKLVPRGVAGELYIAGVQLGRGYLHRPDLTAERFVPDPFATGERMYRTGDLARWLPTGELEYLGRIDHQVKVRGFRIELGEIESALLEQRGVEAAVVVAREDVPGNKRLVAYVTGAVDTSALREVLSTKLPAYMVPSTFVVLDGMPLTPNGKVDRAALPRPDSRTRRHPPVPPRNAAEQRLLSVWSEVLGTDKLCIDDELYLDWSVDSISAARVAARLSRGGINVRVADLFRARTIRQQAELLTDAAVPRQSDHLICLKSTGHASPVVFFHGARGDAFVFLPLVRALDADRPIYALHGDGLDEGIGPAIEDLALIYANELARQLVGPLILGGYSAGARIAFETARILAARGVHVERMLFFEGDSPADERDRVRLIQDEARARTFLAEVSARVPVADTAVPLTDDAARFEMLCTAAGPHFTDEQVEHVFPGRGIVAKIRGAGSKPRWDSLLSALDPDAFSANDHAFGGNEYRRRFLLSRRLRMLISSPPTGMRVKTDLVAFRRSSWSPGAEWERYIDGEVRDEIIHIDWTRPGSHPLREIAEHASLLDEPNVKTYAARVLEALDPVHRR